MYTPPSLHQSNELPQLFKRGALFFGLIAVIGLVQLAVTLDQKTERTVGVVALIIAMKFLPKASVSWMVSLGASLAAVLLAIGLGLLIGIYGRIDVQHGLPMIGVIMSIICWIGYGIAKR